jgi:hypothetical protein
LKPQLIVSGSHFIVRNKKESSFLNCHLSRSKDKQIHDFNHVPTNVVKPMFVWVVFWHFEKIEFLLQPLKFIKGQPSLKKWKIVIT